MTSTVRLLHDTGSFLARAWRLAAPFWRSDERAGAWGLLLAVVVLAPGLVGIDVALNYWNRGFYNALQEKNFDDFKDLLLVFGLLAALYIVGFIYRVYLQQMLQMRWRRWLTERYLDDWLGDRAYYVLELDRSRTDNPDQRIADDLNRFTSQTLSLGLGVLTSIVQLASFAVILWSLSGSLPLSLGGVSVQVPGYLFWAALIYALAGSVVAHFVGRRLIGLNFAQERCEADFRFNLVRLRENAEGIALYRGEAQEQRALSVRFTAVLENWWRIMRATKRLNTFAAGYAQLAIVFPFVVVAPRYFGGEIDLGTLMQVGTAFASVQGALSWFVDNYAGLAEWKAGVDRLLTFQDAMAQARDRAGQQATTRTQGERD